MTESIVGGIVAGLIVLALSPILRALFRMAWHGLAGLAKSGWRRLTNAVSEPLRTEVKDYMAKMDAKMELIDGVLAALQVRVDQALRDPTGAADAPDRATPQNDPGHASDAESSNGAS